MLLCGHSGTNPKSTIACRPGLETIRNAAARHSKFLVPYIARRRLRTLLSTAIVNWSIQHFSDTFSRAGGLFWITKFPVPTIHPELGLWQAGMLLWAGRS